MDFARLAQALGGESVAGEPGERSSLAPFVLAAGAGPEIRVYPELLEGECVGAVFAALRADTAETPRIVLRAEDGLDRGGKALGISREVQLGDADFDAAVYVESEAPGELVARVLAGAAARDAAVALVRGPAGEVQLGEGRVSVRLTAEQLVEDELPGVRAALVHLRALAGAMAVPKDMPTRTELVGRRSVGHIWVLAGAWLVTLALALVLRPPQVLAWGPIFAALGLGLGLWALVGVGLAMVLRGAPDSMRWLVLSAGVFLLTTPFAGMKLALYVNAVLDGGAEVSARHLVTVVDRSETRVLVDVTGLVAGAAPARMAVPMTMVQGTLPKDLVSLMITTRPGALGWPWLVGVGP